MKDLSHNIRIHAGIETKNEGRYRHAGPTSVAVDPDGLTRIFAVANPEDARRCRGLESFNWTVIFGQLLSQ